MSNFSTGIGAGPWTGRYKAAAKSAASTGQGQWHHPRQPYFKTHDMNKIRLFTLSLVCLLFLSMGCNNSGKDNDKATKDTVTAGDTIESDPSKFSDPH